jgi:hypothetical protein
MAPLKLKGDQAEIEVARDLIKRGFRIAIPYGEDWDFDLIFQRPDDELLDRVQVKHATARNGVVAVKCYSHSLTNGRVRRTKRYTAATVDWIAAFDPVSDACYYLPAWELGEGRSIIHLRLEKARNNQRLGVRFAADYDAPYLPRQQELKVEPAGLEPAPSELQTRRSPN